MSKFKKISLILLICGLIASTGIGLWASRDGIYSNGVSTEFKRAILNPGQSMGQTFRATLDHLSKIEFLAGYSDKKVKGIFFLEDTEGKSLREGTFEMRKNQNTIGLIFEPIEKSKGRLFYVHLQTSSDTDSSIGLLESVEPIEGDLRINHHDSEGDLAIRLGYKMEIASSEFFSTIAERISQYKPVWMKTPYLYIYWGLFFVGILGLVVMMVEEFCIEQKDQSRR